MEAEETMKKNRCSRISARQLDLMVTYMEANEDLRDGKLNSYFTKDERKRKWNELAKILNAEGSAVKSAEQWKKSWNDQKGYARNKAAKIKSRSQTVKGIETDDVLTPMEERILSIAGCRPTLEERILSLTGYKPALDYPIEERMLNVTAYVPAIEEPVVEETILPIIKEENISNDSYTVDGASAIEPIVAIQQSVNDLDQNYHKAMPRPLEPEAESSEKKPKRLKKTGSLVKNLREQNELLKRIALANEQIAQACMIIASNAEERTKETTLQTELIRDMNQTLKYVLKQKSNDTFF